ncbi:MAG TPA: IS66 family transposase [Thermodesulfobacteriota bacterium]|nr:IS66 family transposase [Thermodesulfobacteriota bacterium]
MDFVARAQNLESVLHAVERVPSKEQGQPAQFIPIRFIFANKLTIHDKLLVAFDALILSEMVGGEVHYGKIIHGDDHDALRVKTSGLTREVRKLIAKIGALLSTPSAPDLILNRHCGECEFQTRCKQKAIEADDLSLLPGITGKERAKHNKKGIFTVTQLSYTFRPRRKRKRPDGYRRPHSLALRALAIRDKRIYIHEIPALPQTETDVYFDVEGTEEGNFVYLAGILVGKNHKIDRYSFWADTPAEETDIFLQCLRIIESHHDYTVYHYGSYELAYLNRMRKRLQTESQTIDKIVANSCNLLSVLYSNIYFPTFSNGLKEIGSFLGFRWSDEKASGLQSLIWRHEWEKSGSPDYKQKLIQYNSEDCQALSMLKNFMERIRASESRNRENDPDNLVFLKDLKKASPFKFLVGEYALPEFEALNKYGHFDYQRERVHVRTNNYLKKYFEKQKPLKRKQNYKINTSIIPARKEPCPTCKTISKIQLNPLSKKVVDLKFFKGGVKRWVMQLNSYYHYCRKCKSTFIPEWYNNVHRKRYGHNLMGWAIYQHIVNRQSFQQISANFMELFDLRIGRSSVHIFKSYITDYYQDIFEKINHKILNSPVLYVDETPINMKVESGYAWVLTNTEEVISFYKPTREGEFIKEYLSNFRGVLVSDFYSAYDSLDCQQQKCLIHLIRDFNDDLLKNPFNDEFKEMARRFTALLQGIIETVDKRGLKKRYLHKHNKPVKKFFRDILSTEYKSEVAIQYQKRLSKNQDKLFLFLNHDNVSWNNNAAEHAIKLLATHQNKNVNCFRESRIEEYLKIMSIYQTCRYKGISFLKFILSKEKDLDEYCKKLFRRRTIPRMF